MKIKMVSLFWILGFLCISLNSNSQRTQVKPSGTKRGKKRPSWKQTFWALDSLLNAKSFVLEADFLQNKYGDRIAVAPTLNFIKCK